MTTEQVKQMEEAMSKENKEGWINAETKATLKLAGIGLAKLFALGCAVGIAARRMAKTTATEVSTSVITTMVPDLVTDALATAASADSTESLEGSAMSFDFNSQWK